MSTDIFDELNGKYGNICADCGHPVTRGDASIRYPKGGTEPQRIHGGSKNTCVELLRADRDAALERAEQWRLQSEKDAAAAGEERSQRAASDREITRVQGERNHARGLLQQIYSLVLVNDRAIEGDTFDKLLTLSGEDYGTTPPAPQPVVSVQQQDKAASAA